MYYITYIYNIVGNIYIIYIYIHVYLHIYDPHHPWIVDFPTKLPTTVDGRNFKPLLSGTTPQHSACFKV